MGDAPGRGHSWQARSEACSLLAGVEYVWLWTIIQQVFAEYLLWPQAQVANYTIHDLLEIMMEEGCQT